MALRSVPAPRLRLFTLGRLTLEAADGSAVVSSGSSKLLGLLAYLTTAPSRAASRERLIDLFWADRSVGNARASLRQLLSHARSLLGRDALEADELDRVALVTPIWTDREAFLEAIDRSDTEQAFALYGGSFAPGLLSAGTAAFEHWADAERERLRELFVTFGELEARQALAKGDKRAAHGISMRILELEPTEQRAWRIRLEAESLLFPIGRRLAAIAELRAVSSREGVPLETRTTQLLAALEEASVVDPGSHDPLLQGELVGRVHQWEQLHQAWREAQAGRATHLHIAAPAGLGKTRLLTDFAIRLASERCKVIIIRATPRQRDLSYSAAADLITQLSNSPGSAGVSSASASLLIDLVPAISSRFAADKAPTILDADERLRSRTEALLDLTASVAHESPLVLLLDDLHWWDTASRTMISAIVDRLRDVRVLTVTAGRPVAPQFGSELLTLEPLDARSIEEFLLSIDVSGQEERLAEFASRLAEATGGSPLLLMESLRLGMANGSIEIVDDGMDLAGAAEFIGSLRPGTVLIDRVRRLPNLERQTLELAAVLEGAIPGANLAEETRGACLSLERRGLLGRTTEGWQVAHDAIGEVVLEAIPDDRRRETHIAAAVLLAATGETVLQARHLLAGGEIESLTRLADGWIKSQRARGDIRPLPTLLHDLLGGTDDALARNIVRRLSWSARSHPRIGVHAAWALALVSMVAATIALARIGSGSSEVIEFEVTLLPRSGEPSATRYRVILPGDGIPLESSRVRKTSLAVPMALRQHWPKLLTHGDVSATGVSIFTLLDSGYNAPTSLVVVRDSTLLRVAEAPGDDVGQRWSPDGRSLVFETTRYPQGGGGFDLAILDYLEGTVTPLVVSPDQEVSPVWSEDGTRIAYVRRPMDLSPEEVCWIQAKGGKSSCFTQVGVEIRSAEGWDGPGAIRFTGMVGQTAVHYRLDLATGSREYVAAPQGNLCRSAYGLRWTVCIVEDRPPGAPPKRELRLFDSHHPATGLLLAAGPGTGNNVGLAVRWLQPHASPIEQEIEAPASIRVMRGLSTEVPLLLRTTQGSAWSPPSALTTWDIADTSILADSGGRLFGRRPGETTARALTAKNTSTPITVTVLAPYSHLLRKEDWSGDWEAFWQASGDPLPRPIGNGQMLIDGDDEYESGLISRSTFAPERGMAVDAVLSTRVDRSVWQFLRIGFSRDHNRSANRPCGITVPGAEGGAYRHTVGLSAAGQRLQVGSQLTSGELWRLRLQVFPDGSCGVAINGRALFRSKALDLKDPAKLVIYGQSVGTQILVGPLTVWEGVPSGVDWNAN